MIEAKCPQCGAYYCGWALLNPQHQTCSKCGAALEITIDGRKIPGGYSPFTAERYSIDLPSDVPASEDKEKGGGSKKHRPS